jgi:hypothetical protein
MTTLMTTIIIVNVELQNSHLKEFGLTLVFPWHNFLCLNNGDLKQNSAEQVHLKGFIIECSRVPKIVPTYSNRDPWFS